MGILDTLFGTKAKTTSSQTEDIDITTKTIGSQTREQTEASTKTGEQAQQTQQLTTTLDPETLSILQNLIASISGDKTGLPDEISGAISEPLDFARFLAERAAGTEDIIGENIGAIVDEARRTGEQALTAQGTQLAEASGSSLNTVNAAIQGRSRADLESQLASISAELSIRGRELGGQDLSTAFAALTEGLQTGANVSLAGRAQPIQEIASLTQLLKGATTQTTGETTSTFSEEEFGEALVKLLSELTETKIGTVNTTGTVTGTERDSLIGGIGQIFALLDPVSQGGGSGGGGGGSAAGIAALFA